MTDTRDGQIVGKFEAVLITMFSYQLIYPQTEFVEGTKAGLSKLS